MPSVKIVDKHDDTPVASAWSDLDAELHVLATVVRELASVEPDVRLRMLQFLKSKFSKEWPSENY